MKPSPYNDSSARGRATHEGTVPGHGTGLGSPRVPRSTVVGPRPRASAGRGRSRPAAQGRRRHAGGGQDEGTWIFSYADLITLLLMFFLVLLSLAQVSEERFAIVQQGVEKALTGEVKTRPPGRRSTATPKSSSDGPKSAPEVSRKAQTQAQTQVQAQAKSREADPSAAFADVLRRLDSRLVKALGAQTLAEDDAALVVIPVARLFRPRAVTLVPEDARLFHALVSGLVAVTPEGRRLSIEVHTTRASGRFPWGTTATRAGALAEVARTAAPLGWTIEAAGLGASDAQSRRIELRVQVPRVREGGGKK